MKFTKVLISFVLILLSVLILNWKGYFYVREFVVEGRADISQFLTKSIPNTSYVLLDKSFVQEVVTNEFSDVHSLTINRNKKMGLDLNIKEFEPLGSLGDNYFLSSTGKVYYSNKNYSGLVLINFNDPKIGDYLITLDQVYFIQKIQEEHQINSVDIIEPNHFVINLGGVSIEVEKDYSNLLAMLDPTLKFLENAENTGDFSSVIILSNRIVVKE